LKNCASCRDPALCDFCNGGVTMPSWKCSKCGYSFDSDAHPNQCPSCREKCEFLDNTCYTPDCAAEGIDSRIGKPKP
jgi:rubredoxin